jgi:hypothetical protein
VGPRAYLDAVEKRKSCTAGNLTRVVQLLARPYMEKGFLYKCRPYMQLYRGHVVAELVEALWCKPGGSGFNSR